MPGSVKLARYEQTTLPFFVPVGMVHFRWRKKGADYGMGPIVINVCPNCESPNHVDEPWGFVRSPREPGWQACAVCGCKIYGSFTEETAYYIPTPGGFHADDLPREEIRWTLRPKPIICRADR